MAFISVVLLAALQGVSSASSSSFQCDGYTTARPPGFGFPKPIGRVTVTGSVINPSGLAHSRVSKDVLYFVSDKKLGTDVHAINATNGLVIGSIEITGATNVDWNDLAVGVCPTGVGGFCIYVQDGGKEGGEPVNTIYIVREEGDPATDVRKRADKTIRYRTPGNDISESAGIFVDCQGNMYFFGSEAQSGGITLYKIEDNNGQFTAVGVFKTLLPSTTGGPVGASLSEDCSKLLIKMQDKIYNVPVQKDSLLMKRIQVLPYVPNSVENSIAWGPEQDRYYVLAGFSFTLKVAKIQQDPPVHKFGLGRVTGTIDATVSINGLAGSRNHPGIVYAISESDNYDVHILQIYDSQSIGVVKTGITDTMVSFTDMATGACPSYIDGESCIYINSHKQSGSDQYKVYVFEEPVNIYGETTLTLGAQNTLVYTMATVDKTESIMIGRAGEIYMMDSSASGAPVTLFQLIINTGSANTLQTLASLVSFARPSLYGIPEAMDMSPCFDEIIVKFKDVVLLFDVKGKSVEEALKGRPSFEPYLPDPQGYTVAFAGCNAYLTAAYSNDPVPLVAYNRI